MALSRDKGLSSVPTAQSLLEILLLQFRCQSFRSDFQCPGQFRYRGRGWLRLAILNAINSALVDARFLGKRLLRKSLA